MFSTNCDNVTSYQFGCLLFLFLSHYYGKDCQYHLNKSGGSGHVCLVVDLRWKAIRFPQLIMMSAVSLSYVAFIMLRHIPFTSALLRVSNHKLIVDFIKCFLCIYGDDNNFSFSFVMWYIMFLICILDTIPLDCAVWSCYVLLNLIIFCWKFFYVHQKNWPVIFFFVMSLPDFGIRTRLDSWNEFGSVTSSSIFGEFKKEIH